LGLAVEGVDRVQRNIGMRGRAPRERKPTEDEQFKTSFVNYIVNANNLNSTIKQILAGFSRSKKNHAFVIFDYAT
jgi:hypothetical protein